MYPTPRYMMRMKDGSVSRAILVIFNGITAIGKQARL